MKHIFRLILYVVGLILVFSSCEKEEKIDPDIEEVFVENGAGTVGKAGGEVILDEIKLIIPPNALSEPTEISIEKSDISNSNKVYYLDSKFTLSPGGLSFNTPVQLQIDLSETNAEKPVFMQVYLDNYLQIHESSFDSSKKIITIDLEHFSEWALKYNADYSLKINTTHKYFIHENFSTIYTGQSLGDENTQQVFNSINGAFNQWEQFLLPTRIKFSKTEDEDEAEIIFISNSRYDINDHFNFYPFQIINGEINDPVESVINRSNGKIYVFFYEVDQWLTTKQIASGVEGNYSIEQYAAHEVGHILGLQPLHSSQSDAIMYCNQKNRKPGALTSDDVEMLANAYHFDPSELPYGCATKIEILSETENSVPKLKSVDFNPKVRVLDDSGNGVPGVPVLFISDPVGIVRDPVGRTDDNGEADCGYWITADSDENQTMLARTGAEESQIAQFDIETISADGYYPKSSGTFIDNRDNQEYRWVKIGEQIWMAENLNYGPMVPSKDYWKHQDITKCCYDNNETNCEEFGGLYTWWDAMDGASSSNLNPSGVQGICPEGWHLPSDEEWNDLERFLGTEEEMIYIQGLNTRGRVGQLLRSTSGWYTEEYSGYQGYDSFGFNAQPYGYRHYTGGDNPFYGLSFFSEFWSSTYIETITSAYARQFDNKFNIFRNTSNYRLGFSVRCVKD